MSDTLLELEDQMVTGECGNADCACHELAKKSSNEKWSYDFSDGEYHIRTAGNSDYVAHTRNYFNAEQITANHNQHQFLVAERERLIEALKGVAIMLNTELEKYDKEPWAQRVRAAIVTVDQKVGPQ